MRFVIYRDAADEWRWRLKAANGETIADSAESYTRERDVERAIRTVRSAIWRAEVVKT